MISCWHFAVNAGSPKAQQITAEPRIALTFYWSTLGRQIRIRGTANLLLGAECVADFLDRPVSARVRAISSLQSAVLEDASLLVQKRISAEKLFESDPDYISPDWQLYAVLPNIIEFWQGASDRNHKRVRFAPALDE
jgi:pyridoxamine 5'-phosphate oxidase